jgi:hypothetical protein
VTVSMAKWFWPKPEQVEKEETRPQLKHQKPSEAPA